MYSTVRVNKYSMCAHTNTYIYCINMCIFCVYPCRVLVQSPSSRNLQLLQLLLPLLPQPLPSIRNNQLEVEWFLHLPQVSGKLKPTLYITYCTIHYVHSEICMLLVEVPCFELFHWSCIYIHILDVYTFTEGNM